MKQPEIIHFIGEHKSKILHIVIILFALNIAHKIYSKTVLNLASLSEKKEIEIKKNETLKEILNVQNKLDTIVQVINKKDVSLVMDKLGSMAKETSVKIISFKPNPVNEFPTYLKYTFDLTVAASNYHDIGRFITKIESSADTYQVDSCIISLQGQQQDAAKGKLIITLKLSTIVIKK